MLEHKTIMCDNRYAEDCIRITTPFGWIIAEIENIDAGKKIYFLRSTDLRNYNRICELEKYFKNTSQYMDYETLYMRGRIIDTYSSGLLTWAFTRKKEKEALAQYPYPPKWEYSISSEEADLIFYQAEELVKEG